MQFSRTIGRLRGDRMTVVALILAALGLAGWGWLQEHPQHNPWAPLDLNDPPGWATPTKIAALKNDPELCQNALARSDIANTVMPSAGEGACLRTDNVRLIQFDFAPSNPAMSCRTAAGLSIWIEQVVKPAAREYLGAELAGIVHLGTYSCRRLYGRDSGPWSEHATANAIDIAGFTFTDGQKISLLADWNGDAERAQFLRAVRDGACGTFSTVLSPEYNAAHRDHFHFDQADRAWGACR